MDTTVIVFLALSAIASGVSLVYLFVIRPKIKNQNQTEMLQAISAAIEARTGRDGEAYAIRSLALKIGNQLRMKKSRLLQLSHTALVCDIGMCAIPYEAVRSHYSTDMPEEKRSQIERHPEIGASILSLVKTLNELSELVRCHHAPFDGSSDSYLPVGDEIPIESRILYVSSAFLDAVDNHGSFLARETILDGSGAAFCPIVVSALFEVLKTEQINHHREKAIAV